MSFLDSVILGVVEGLTEFLPISSTGHLILTSHLLGLGEDETTKAFEIMIQSGAILAVIWEYRVLLKKTFSGLFRNEKSSTHLTRALIISFLPAVVIGLSFGKWIKKYLFGVESVIWALLIGGILMIIIERKMKAKNQVSDGRIFSLPNKSALIIGFAQCLSLWPGMSRAMTTILGARLVGLSPKDAAQYSFLLAIPTILAATAYDLFKSRAQILSGNLDPIFIGIGMLVSFVTALLVIRGLLKFLSTHSLEVFGWYRIALSIALLILLRI